MIAILLYLAVSAAAITPLKKPKAAVLPHDEVVSLMYSQKPMLFQIGQCQKNRHILRLLGQQNASDLLFPGFNGKHRERIDTAAVTFQEKAQLERRLAAGELEWGSGSQG